MPNPSTHPLYFLLRSPSAYSNSILTFPNNIYRQWIPFRPLWLQSTFGAKNAKSVEWKRFAKMPWYWWVNMKLIFRVTMLPRYECFEHRLTSRIHQSGKFAADDHIGRSGRMQILDNGLGDWDEAPGWYHGVGGSWVCLLPRTLSPDGKSFRQNGPILRFSATAIKSVLFMMLESKQNLCFILGKSLMGLGKPLIRHIKMEVKLQNKDTSP